LAIPTANEDADRIASLIRNNMSSIDRIIATLDSHRKLHIAHPAFWVGEDGKNPSPFTIIASDEVESGKWKPREDLKVPSTELDTVIFEKAKDVIREDGSIDLLKYCIEYTRALEKKGRFQLCIWPEHCIVGTEGHCVVPTVYSAIDEWSNTTGASVEWVYKGENLLTENYSCLCADVPVSSSTSFHTGLHGSLMTSSQLLVAGQAMSHCVNYTLRDIISKWPADKCSKVCLLTDCASPVPGFEEAADKFTKDMEEAGVKLCVAAQAFDA